MNPKQQLATIGAAVVMVAGTLTGLSVTNSFSHGCRAPHNVGLAAIQLSCPAPGATTTTTAAGTTTTGGITTTTASTVPTTTTTVPLSGFPNASNTGTPSGTVLTTYTGPNPITACGTVLNAQDFTTGISITASNGTTSMSTPCVTITNSRVEGVLFTQFSAAGPTVISDTTIIGNNTDSTPPLWQWNWYGTRLNISGGRGQADCDGPCSLFDSYIHDINLPNGSNNHLQAWETNGDGAGPILLQHNSFNCSLDFTPGPSGGCASDVSSFGDTGGGGISHITVNDNFFFASVGTFGYCTYTGAAQPSKPFPTGTFLVYTNNVFQTGASGKCGDNGTAIADWACNTGNVGNAGGLNKYSDGSTVTDFNGC